MVRSFAILLLIGSILACPFLCGAIEASHVARHRLGATGPLDHSSTPDDCPQEGDNCICRGAIESADVRLPDLDTIGWPLSFHDLTGILDHAPVLSGAFPALGSTPTGFATWKEILTVCALLQVFRC